MLVFDIDLLGISGGTGIIFYADADNCETARQSRDKFADHVMKNLHDRVEAGRFSEIAIVEPGHQE